MRSKVVPLQLFSKAARLEGMQQYFNEILNSTGKIAQYVMRVSVHALDGN